jgi:hypothetical protein
MLRQVFFALAILSVAFATYGVDMSQDECGSVGESDWSCIAQNGINFAIIQAWDGGLGEGSNVARKLNVFLIPKNYRMRFTSLECWLSSC